MGILTQISKKALISESTKLRVFDFDDTLVFTKSYIYVKKPDGSELKLTPGEYALYKEKPDEEYDYRDFYSVQEPQEIKKMTSVLKRIIQKNGSGNVHILTARPQAAATHIKQYLKDIGITQDIQITGLQDNNPQAKADWIEKKIDSGNYDDVYFADDSVKNINAVKAMLQKKQIRWRAQLIKH